MRRIVALSAIFASLTVAGALAFGPPDHKPTPAEIQAEMERAAKPGPEHTWLTQGVGKWNGDVKMWMGADATVPTESKCTTVNKAIIDGRFVTADVSGTMMGGPFTGFGLMGFDNETHQYQMSWVDNMSTQIMRGTGEMSPDHKTLTWSMSMNNGDGSVMHYREVDHFLTDDTMQMEMFGPDMVTGKEFKVMEINYLRAK